jgi:hypothetical protein
MLDLLRPTYDFALTYANKLVADIPDDQLAAQPVPGRAMNHAAFLLGHLAWANDNGAALLGLPRAHDDAWKDLFGMGARPLPDRARYPDKATLLAALAAAHARLADAVANATPEALAQPAPERMRRMFPTVGHMLAGLMTAHYANHNGQLSAWRRAMGFPSAF